MDLSSRLGLDSNRPGASTRVDGGADRAAELSGDTRLLHADAWLRFMGAQIESFLTIDAPSGDEFERGRWFLARLREMGYDGAQQDAVGNVLAPFVDDYAGRWLVLDAHLDTAFPRGAARPVRKSGGLWYGPGVYDDGAGLAILLALMKLYRADPPAGAERLLFCFSAGEEGVGDLRGMRELFRARTGRIAALYTLDGLFGKESMGAVGSRRYRVEIGTPGGHSWADFGRPSAIHEITRWLARAQGALSAATEGMRYARPGQASSWNVGTLQGGTTVNSIAARAQCEIDLRSSDPAALEILVATVLNSVERFDWPAGAQPTVTRIGDRPTAEVAATAHLRDLRARLHARLGVTARETIDSTNANWALHCGVPATSIGVAIGGDAHTEQEWLEFGSLMTGLRFVNDLVRMTLADSRMVERY
ncbi:MAG: M20/M25/M40 family metallo-hydrolase [Planctomycetota bacterium]